MFLLSVENIILQQYHCGLHYNQGLNLFLLWLYIATGWREDILKLSASKIVRGARLRV